jgi:hypothetical protein
MVPPVEFLLLIQFFHVVLRLQEVFFFNSKVESQTMNLLGVWMEDFLALNNRMLVDGMKNVVVLH